MYTSMMLGSMHLTPSALGSICMRLYCEGAHTCLTDGTSGAQNRTSSKHVGRPFSGSSWHRAFSGHSLIPPNNLGRDLQINVVPPSGSHHRERAIRDRPSNSNPKCTALEDQATPIVYCIRLLASPEAGNSAHFDSPQ